MNKEIEDYLAQLPAEIASAISRYGSAREEVAFRSARGVSRQSLNDAWYKVSLIEKNLVEILKEYGI